MANERLEGGLVNFFSFVNVDRAVEQRQQGKSAVHAAAEELRPVEPHAAVGKTLAIAVDDHVRLEVVLPWLLAKVAATIQPLIRKEGMLLLEKK